MGGHVVPRLQLIAFHFFLVCFFLVLNESISANGNLDKIPFENDGYENVHSTSRRLGPRLGPSRRWGNIIYAFLITQTFGVVLKEFLLESLNFSTKFCLNVPQIKLVCTGNVFCDILER